MKLLFTVLSTFCLSLMVGAQTQTHHLWEGSFMVGGTNYQGDLVDRAFPYLSETGLAVGAFGRYVLNPNWGIRGGVWHGRISGSDGNSKRADIAQTRALSFESTLTEFSVKLEWEPLGHKRYAIREEFQEIFSPFIFIGAGFSSFNTRTDFSRIDLERYADQVKVDMDNRYPLTTFSLPIGVGFRADLSEQYTLGVEFSTTTPFSDYVDGVSAAGNSDKKDWYQSGGIFISRRFGKRDSDKDGLVNKEDGCPFEFGSVQTMGCPDQDGDLISDQQDLCPTLPGSAETYGCPDSDGDLIPDIKDKCPQVAGLKTMEGCPDSDADGLIDSEDQCPEVAGLKSMGGCPDTDADGVADPEDNCPNMAGLKELNGCPEVKEVDQTILEEAQRMVLFNTGSAVLKEESYEVLNQVAELLNRYPDYQLRISGHTDNQGDPYANLLLSEKRAKACKEYLAEQGVKSYRLRYKGYGESQPVTSNDTEEGRQKNRRVVFELSLY